MTSPGYVSYLEVVAVGLLFGQRLDCGWSDVAVNLFHAVIVLNLLDVSGELLRVSVRAERQRNAFVAVCLTGKQSQIF